MINLIVQIRDTGCHNSHMYIDLHSLLSATEILDFLKEPFIKEEINSVVQHLPTDKSPGPDGFNGGFLKCVGRQ
jgi:hypothetical protein